MHVLQDQEARLVVLIMQRLTLTLNPVPQPLNNRTSTNAWSAGPRGRELIAQPRALPSPKSYPPKHSLRNLDPGTQL